MKMRREQRVFVAVFMAPSLFLFTAFVALPAITALGYSFLRWDGLSAPVWCGLDNFRALLADRGMFFSAILHNLFLMVVGGGFVLTFSLFFAAVLHRRVRGATIFRVAFFFPNVLASVVVALLWVLLYSTSDFGVLNGMLLWIKEAACAQNVFLARLQLGLTIVTVLSSAILVGFIIREIVNTLRFRARMRRVEVVPVAQPATPGLKLALMSVLGVSLILMWTLYVRKYGGHAGLPAEWLRGGVTAAMNHLDLPFPFAASQYLLIFIVPMMVWTATGFYMILFLAAMENIPETFYEAARLDGASEFVQFRMITLPLIRDVLTVGMVFLVIGCLKFFDAVWVMENEHPIRDSHVMATLLYQKVFSEYNVGYGSAVAVLLFALVFIATLLTLRLSRKEALEY